MFYYYLLFQFTNEINSFLEKNYSYHNFVPIIIIIIIIIIVNESTIL